MIIKTANFRKLQSLLLAGYEPVSICGKAPDWYGGYQYRKLAPKWSFFKDYKDGIIDAKEYTRQYDALVLDKLDSNEVYSWFKNLGKDKIAWLCYEEAEEFCHRHLAAKWLSKMCNINIVEYENEVTCLGCKFFTEDGDNIFDNCVQGMCLLHKKIMYVNSSCNQFEQIQKGE